MTQVHSAINAHKIAKLSGCLYITIAVFGGFSIGYIPTVIVAAGDAAQTTTNLTENFNLYRAGLFADLIVILCEIVLSVLLYHLLKPVDQTLSMIAAVARISMVLVMALNLILGVIPILLIRNTAYLSSFEDTQLQSVILLIFDARQFGVYLWGVFFGLHLAVLGGLVIKSGYFPRVLGWMMAIGSLGYVIEGFSQITMTNSTALSFIFIALLTLVTIGEMSFALWLLAKGVNMRAWPASPLNKT